GLVFRIDVVVDPDSGRLLEAGDRAVGHVVGPVVDVQNLAAVAGFGTGLAGAARGKNQGAGKRGEAQGHGILQGGCKRRMFGAPGGGVNEDLPRPGSGVSCADFRPSRAGETMMKRSITRGSLAVALA